MALRDWFEWFQFRGSGKEIEVGGGFLDKKTKRYIIWLIYEQLIDRYSPDISAKERSAIFDDVYKKLREEIRKLGESENETNREIFNELLEKRGPDLTKELYRLMGITWDEVRKEYEGREETRRKTLVKKKVIKINTTNYRCPEEGCNGSIEEHVYGDHSKAYVCGNHPDYHVWSLEDIKKGAAKYAKKKLSEGLKEAKSPGEIAEIKPLFKEGEEEGLDIEELHRKAAEEGLHVDLKDGLKTVGSKEWEKLGIEERKAYVSEFLKHPALGNQIKKLRRDKGRLWWLRPSYYNEAEKKTGFKERKKEIRKEMRGVRKDLRGKYGPAWFARPKYWAEKNEKNGELRDKYYNGGGFGPEEEKFMRKLIGGVDRVAGRHSEHVKGVMPAIIILGLGAVISIILGSLMFFFAFCSVAFQQLMPPAKEKTDKEGKGTGEWENLGSAYLRSVFKCTAIILFALGIGQTNLPFPNIVLMLVAIGGYASMKVTYHQKRSDELVESFIRFGFLGVLVIPWFIFAQIFGSMTLGLLALMFFAVPPIKIGGGETEAVERTFAYQIWRPIFLVGMLIVLISSGAIPINLPMFNLGWALEGSLAYIFMYIWFVAFLAGVFTSPENLPSIGIIILIVTTVIFGLGPGAQNVGIAMFGQWWPTVHNTVTEFTEPLGDLFYQLSQTFGQTLFMISNPMGFAQQITEGNYVENPTGPTGAYGLEIGNFQVDGIYIGEPFPIRFELENKGSFQAKNVSMEIWTSIEKFNYIRDETDTSKQGITLARVDKPEKLNYIDWYKYRYNQFESPFLNQPIRAQDIKPRFLFGEVDCEGQAKIKEMLGVTTSRDASLRMEFIPFMVMIKYNYEVYSNLQVEILSQQEWDSRSRNGMLLRGQKLSRISTAPAKLSIGAMDQPISEGLPMFIGFNISSEEGKDSKVGKATVRLEFPEGFAPDIMNMRCTVKEKPAREVQNNDNKRIIEWELEEDEPKHVICFFSAPSIGDAPSKTFTISASANYTFYRWERDNTQINFMDACEESREEGTKGIIQSGDAEYCSSKGLCIEVGEGGCLVDGNDYCDKNVFKPPRDDQNVTALKCYENVNEGKGACCPGEGYTVGTEIKIEGVTDSQCQAAFEAWMEKKSETEILNAMWAVA